MRNFRHSIKHVVFGWLYNKDIEPIDIAQSIDDYYRINHRDATNAHELLDILSKNCISEEVAFNWAISRLSNRIGKEKAMETFKEIMSSHEKVE